MSPVQQINNNLNMSSPASGIPSHQWFNIVQFLEADDLKNRAEVLVAITEIELERGKNTSNSLQ